nr:hypothetical protein [Tanacetum cinerariifolium]GEZ07553.1 hypothetical protein [Tanacetum cinerariifolium]
VGYNKADGKWEPTRRIEDGWPSRRLQQDVHEDLLAAEDISYESKVESHSAEDYSKNVYMESSSPL